MNQESFYRVLKTVNTNCVKYLEGCLGKVAEIENSRLRKTQLDVLNRYCHGGSAIEVMAGEGVLSLLALTEGLLDKVVLNDKEADVLKLTKMHVNSLGLEDKVILHNADIKKVDIVGEYDYCLAICTEMFNPNEERQNVLGREYDPPLPISFLQKAKTYAGKVIVMEAYKKDKKLNMHPEDLITEWAKEAEMQVETGTADYGDGILYFGVLQQ